MYVALYGPKGLVIFDHPYNADSLERTLCVHDDVSLGVSARRGPILWSHVLDVRSRDCPFVAALLTFEAFDRSLVMDMSTTQSCQNPWRPRRATLENAESARRMSSYPWR